MIRLLSSGCKTFVLAMVFIAGFLFLPGFSNLGLGSTQTFVIFELLKVKKAETIVHKAGMYSYNDFFLKFIGPKSTYFVIIVHNLFKPYAL